MHALRDILNRSRWSTGDLHELVITVTHRGAPLDQRPLAGSRIVAITASGVELAEQLDAETTFVPYHRFLSIHRAEVLIWDRHMGETHALTGISAARAPEAEQEGEPVQRASATALARTGRPSPGRRVPRHLALASRAMADDISTLQTLPRGTRLLFAGDQLIRVPDLIADQFVEGDALVVAESTRQVLLIPKREREIAHEAVSRALSAFALVRSASDENIARFFTDFAGNLADDDIWRAIEQANARDVESAKQRGRSTTRLSTSEAMRRAMIEGLHGWTKAASRRGQVLETVQHEGFRAELVGAALGVVAFVFEGRPNVLADATGVLRSGNTVVLRIGRDALGTAHSIMELALRPALRAAGLPEHSVGLLESSEHASGWALFGDKRLGLAVARGSGPAVATLGSLAQQAGVPVSLHGTGGAWIMTSATTRASDLEAVVAGSLDRKVCNTLNVLCILRARAQELVPAALRGMERAASARKQAFKLHVVRGGESVLPAELFTRKVQVGRAEGPVEETQAERIEESQLGHEWEWEESPELTLVVVDSLTESVALFNRESPQFIASLLSDDQREQQDFYESVNAPFVGDGITRWVDGQKALRKPELGLANWQFGRLFGRGGILTGDGVLTVRTRSVRT